MQAVILAAGMGKRLKELTQNNTKCMVKVNGVTLIDRMLHQLDRKHLSRIIIVVGYEGQKLIEYIGTLKIQTPIVFINNPIFDKTNNIYSLALAKEWLCKDDTLLFESDIIFEDDVLEILISDPRDTLALVDKYEAWMDGTCLKLDENDNIIGFASGQQFNFNEIADYYKTVNLYKFSKHFSETHYVPFLEAYQSALGENEYYEQVLRVIAMLDNPVIKAKRLSGQRWYEIDDVQDLDIAESLFAPSEDMRVELLQRRYGGYWRYPKMLDFCYLVNPYFPPQKMKDEMRASFDTLLTEYPSGMRVNSLLAGKIFGIPKDNIVIGNGAAELIKSLMGLFSGTVGFVRPTFEEYPNRYNANKTISFVPDNPDFSYTADDLISYFSNNKVDNLVVVNPDNPSGNYISKADLLRLIKWAKMRGIKCIIDESFVDFADEENSSLMDQAILSTNPHLYVMKSISKSYGVPGIRLGVLASGNIKTITEIKNDVAIWNINSFGEFFMQIFEKYRKAYTISLTQVRKERTRFQRELSNIQGVRVIPSQANYVMLELEGEQGADQLMKNLLIKHNILVKNLSNKTKRKNYLRLAIRNSFDNDRLLAALREETGTL